MTESELRQIIREVIYLNEKNDALLIDKEVRKFIALKGKRNTEENIEILKDIVLKNYDLLKGVRDKFYNVVSQNLPKKGSSQNYKFLYQIKSMSSIIDKIIKRNKSLANLSDMVRGAVLFKDPNELDEFVKNLKRKNKGYVVGYEFKAKGSDPTYGYYGSHHFDLNIDGLDVELQAMTEKLWNYKEAAHGIYTKWRSKKGKIDKFDSNLSKKLFNLGNVRESIIIDGELFEYDLFF